MSPTPRPDVGGVPVRPAGRRPPDPPSGGGGSAPRKCRPAAIAARTAARAARAMLRCFLTMMPLQSGTARHLNLKPGPNVRVTVVPSGGPLPPPRFLPSTGS